MLTQLPLQSSKQNGTPATAKVLIIYRMATAEHIDLFSAVGTTLQNLVQCSSYITKSSPVHHRSHCGGNAGGVGVSLPDCGGGFDGGGGNGNGSGFDGGGGNGNGGVDPNADGVSG